MTAFSQAGSTTRDTSTICLPIPIAKEIVKEILRGDSAKEENTLLWKNSDILTNQIRLKDSQIRFMDSLLANKNEHLATKDTILSLKDRQIAELAGLNTKLQEEYKKQKRKSTIKEVTGGAIIAAIVALLIVR